MQDVDRRTFLSSLAAGAISLSVRGVPSSIPDAAEILHRRVDVQRRSVGMAAAIVTGQRSRIFCAGRERLTSDRKVSGDTVFEIASITKIFTALLLANAVRWGKVAIDDPVTKHLPSDFVLPQRDGRPITLADLATHTSGLPSFPPLERNQSLATYSDNDFKAWLASFELTRMPGSQWEYSNAGYTLLGLAIAHRADRSFDEVLQRQLLDPLELHSTFMNPPASAAERLAEGHDRRLKPGPSFDDGIFAPSGGLLSTANDFARFIGALMPGSGSTVEPLQRFLLSMRRPAAASGGQQAIGWEVLPAREGDFVSKDGVSVFQCASAVIDPIRHLGVIALSNTAAEFRATDTSPSGGGVGAADVARHLLWPSIPLGA